MRTTVEDIKGWIRRGQNKQAKFMIVVCDTFDYGDYPVFVDEDEDVFKIIKYYNGKNMQKIMEVYNLFGDINSQLKERRAGLGIYF